MSELGEKDGGSPGPEESRGIRSQLARLARREAALAHGLESVLASGSFDGKEFARLLAGQWSTIEHRLVWTLRWMDQLDQRMSHVESRLSTLTGQASDQEEALRMMCSVLRDLDDPYGFGVSLDERIMGDRQDPAPGELED
jgi:hypothetical protein